MKCTRGLAALRAHGYPFMQPECPVPAVKFFRYPGTSFIFAACPKHAERPPSWYVECSEKEYTTIQEAVDAGVKER